MLDFEEKKKIKNIIYSKVSIVVVAVLLVLVAKSTWSVYSDEKITKNNRVVAEGQLKDLKKREKILNTEITNLQTPEGKEKEIRDKFRVAKKGEKMIMIVNPEDDSYNLKDYVKKDFWSKAISFFKKIF